MVEPLRKMDVSINNITCPRLLECQAFQELVPLYFSLEDYHLTHPMIFCLAKKFFQLRAIGMEDLHRLPLFAHPYKINESVCQAKNVH
jgi:hypothetical protein